MVACLRHGRFEVGLRQFGLFADGAAPETARVVWLAERHQGVRRRTTRAAARGGAGGGGRDVWGGWGRGGCFCWVLGERRPPGPGAGGRPGAGGARPDV